GRVVELGRLHPETTQQPPNRVVVRVEEATHRDLGRGLSARLAARLASTLQRRRGPGAPDLREAPFEAGVGRAQAARSSAEQPACHQKCPPSPNIPFIVNLEDSKICEPSLARASRGPNTTSPPALRPTLKCRPIL